MATTGQKMTTKKRPSQKGTKRTSKQTRQADQRKPLSNDLKYELLVLFFIAMSLLLIISVYINGGGQVGQWVRYAMFGTFGVSAYLLPIFILVAAFIKVFNKGNARINDKLSLTFIGIIIVATFFHIHYVNNNGQLFGKIEERIYFFEVTALYFQHSATSHLAGGLVGGVVGDLFVNLLGRYGSFIILTMISLALIIIITEQSVLKLAKGLWDLLGYLGYKALEASKAMIDKLKVKVTDYQVSKAQEEEVKMGYVDLAQEPLRPSAENQVRIGVKDKFNFLKKSTLWQAEGKEDTNETSSLDKAIPPDRKASKDKTQPLKIHGLDPFEQIVRHEEKERKEKATGITSAMPDPKGQISFGLDKEVSSGEALEETKEKPTPIEAIQTEIQTQIKEQIYKFPPMELMKQPVGGTNHTSKELIEQNAQKLITTLESFGVGAKVLDVSVGPTVTRYELQPDVGVKVSKIVNLQDDIALNLAASGIRIEAPIPGKSAIGIEVPNLETKAVVLREVIDTPEFSKNTSKIAFALGKDIGGKVMIADIARMPHLLIAGATGSGKSVCVNTLITSILYKASPEDVKLLMIDPKVVELSVYNGIPHLLIPVVTEAKKAAGALNWAVSEMNDRYKLFAAANVRDLKGYNAAVEEKGEGKKLPQIVIIVDELADLMMVAQNDVEDAICRLAQMARAAGLHVIIATQRPSVDVITGLIKANIPSRIAFNVSSGVDSRTIIDTVGAEKLLGKGDMLYYPVGLQKPVRVQGAFVSDKEVENIVTYLKDQTKAKYDDAIIKQLNKTAEAETTARDESEVDEYFAEALDLVVDKQKASASMIQRYFRVGYNRAARIVDQLAEAGFVGEEEGSKPRRVLLTKEAFFAMKAEDLVEQEEETDKDPQEI